MSGKKRRAEQTLGSVKRQKALISEITDPMAYAEFKYTVHEIGDQYNAIGDVRASQGTDGEFPLQLLDTLCNKPPKVERVGLLLLDLEQRAIKYAEPYVPAVMTEQYALLYINMYHLERDSYHSNVLIIDNKTKLIERFEPHGSDIDHVRQPTSFKGYYDSKQMERFFITFVADYYPSYTYLGPLVEYPVIAQSLTTCDGPLNREPRPGNFKRKRSDPSGDSFCNAWVTYYALLRLLNTDRSRVEVYTYLSHDGPWLADRIANFIMLAHCQYVA